MSDLPVDHVELLTTAAVRWGVVVAVPAVVLTKGAGLFRFDAEQTAGLFLELRRLAIGEPVPDRYVFRPVDWPVDPVQVIKAVHCCNHLFERLAEWQGSVAQQILGAVEQAAKERLPGYGAAAWAWSRPSTQAGAPIGVGAAWRPPITGLSWRGVDVDLKEWSQARMVVVAADVLGSLPALPRRSNVYVLAKAVEGLPDLWPPDLAVSRLLTWPVCLPWLTEQIASGSSRR